ncbi:MAG: MFS transporter [Leptospirales bacterium]|nr:MFS transporter [Leptospirales bacterium]
MSQLSTSRKIAYAAGGLGMNLSNLITQQWLYKFYTDGGYVTGAVIGVFMIAGRLTDAITDPLVAWWSDITYTRRGRRIPFVLYGMVPFALVIWLLWTPPFEGPHWLNAVYACAMIQLFYIFYTIVVAPYLALLPEIVSGVSARLNLTTMQALWTTVGTMLFALGGVAIEYLGYSGMGLIVAALCLISFLPTVFLIKEQPGAAQNVEAAAAGASVLRWIGITISNRPFRYVIATTSLYWFALATLLLFVPQWVAKVLHLPETGATALMGPFIVIQIVFFFVFNKVSKAIGKKASFLGTLLLTGISLLLIWVVGLFPYLSLTLQSTIYVSIAAIPVAGFLVLPFALLSDCVDLDEKQTGQRREAIFFGVQAFFQKSLIGIANGVYALIDSYYDGPDEITGLKLSVTVAGIACIVAFFIFLGYPLRERGEQVVLS